MDADDVLDLDADETFDELPPFDDDRLLLLAPLAAEDDVDFE